MVPVNLASPSDPSVLYCRRAGREKISIAFDKRLRVQPGQGQFHKTGMRFGSSVPVRIKFRYPYWLLVQVVHLIKIVFEAVKRSEEHTSELQSLIRPSYA